MPLQIAALARRRLDVAQATGRPAPRCGRRPARPARSLSTPRDVAGEAGHRDPAAQAADQRAQALAAPRPRSRNGPRPSRWSNRRPSPARPRSPSAANAASSVGWPISGSGSSFQSPVCSIVPCGVRMASACASGIECATRRNSQRERRQSIAPPGGTVWILTSFRCRPRPACAAARRRRRAWR